MYAKPFESYLVYPEPEDFPGYPQWRTNDVLLRSRGFLPVTDIPDEERIEGCREWPLTWHVVQQSATRPTKRYVPVQEYGNPEEPDTPTGTHSEWVDDIETYDTSYIQVDSWRFEEVPQEDTGPTEAELARDAAEKQIVATILDLVVRYNALEALQELPDISIPGLLGLATQFNVTAQDLQQTMMLVQVYILQLEAVAGGDWASCWQGLKSRFMQWASEILSEQENS